MMYRLIFMLCVALAALPQAHGDQLDDLLTNIDNDISAKRLSTPLGNNAIEKIQQFRTLAPFDMRVYKRAYTVAELYIQFAESAMQRGQLNEAQDHLDKAWNIAYLAEGLEETQEKLNAEFIAKGRSAPKVKAATDIANAASAGQKKAIAKKKTENKQKAAAAQVATAPVSKPKTNAPAPRTEKRVVRQQAPKPQPKAPIAPVDDPLEDTKPIAEYPVAQTLIDNREKFELMSKIEPVCEQILNEDASVVIKTYSDRDYRWLTVRLTLCLRRLDRDFRLRQSHESIDSGEPTIALHPPRDRAIRL